MVPCRLVLGFGSARKLMAFDLCFGVEVGGVATQVLSLTRLKPLLGLHSAQEVAEGQRGSGTHLQGFKRSFVFFVLPVTGHNNPNAGPTSPPPKNLEAQ